MKVIITIIISLIGYIVSGYDFATIYLFISISFDLLEITENYANEKTTNGR